MATTADVIRDEMTAAWKAGDTVRRDTLRLLIASLQNARIAAGHDLAEDEVIRVLQKEARQRRDSIEEFSKANRTDLVAKEEAELRVIEGYLPVALTDDEIRAIAREVIAEAGASGAGDVGKVMRPILARVAGRADGNVVNRIVREQLG